MFEIILAGLEGKWSRAIEDYKRAIAIDPLNADLTDDLTVTFAALNRYDEALCVYDGAEAHGLENEIRRSQR
jgi:tetratricopeptide (TPR) repeat protein